MFPPTIEQVNQHTTPEVNKKIIEKTNCKVTRAATLSRAELDKRQQQLRHEWDLERTFEALASVLVVIGSLLSLFKSRCFSLLALVAGVFLLQHALQGWSPPLTLIRRLGLRTSDEIASERTALGLLNGDLRSSSDPVEALAMTKQVFVTSED